MGENQGMAARQLPCGLESWRHAVCALFEEAVQRVRGIAERPGDDETWLPCAGLIVHMS